MGHLLAVLLCLAPLLAGCAHEETIRPPKPPADNTNARAAAATRTLDALASAVRSPRSGDPGRLAAPGGSGVVRGFVRNAHALGVRDLSLRYVDGGIGAVTGAQERRFGGRAWVGAVEAGYRLSADPGSTHMEVAFTFVADHGRARILSVGGHGDRSALWMRGPVTLARHGHATVIDAGRDAARYGRLARHAVADVRRVLPDWHGRLVVEVPHSEHELDSLLQADSSTYQNIAAVTTSVDGTLVRGTPVHVFINPPVFGTLEPKGAQVVLSHEATHVATGATFTHMPTWLLEGFADYVALDHAGVPVNVAAAQVLRRIRRHGPPHHLPTAKDLNPTAHGLGATYEEAWLACRYLSRQYGEHALVRFYRSVSGGTSLARALEALGTSTGRFTRSWTHHLVGLARSAGPRR